MCFIPKENVVQASFGSTQFATVFNEYGEQQMVACKYIYPPEPRYTFTW